MLWFEGDKKTQIEDLEKQLKKEQDKKKVEEGKLRKKLDKEKAKLDEEKDKRIEVLRERNELMAEKIVIVEKLDIAESNWVDLKMKVNELEGEWEENRASYQKSIEDLRTQNTTLRDRISNKDKEKESEVNLKKKEISDLQFAIEVRKGHFTNLLGDLENKREEIIEMKKYVDEMRNRAERAERLAEELKEEKKRKNERTSAQMTPPVAEPEKPKPLLAKHEKPTQESMIEEEESDCQEGENTLLQTTGGGACADLDSTGYKFKEPEVPQKRRTIRKKSSKDKRGESSEDSSQSEDRKRDRQGRRKNSESTQSEDKEMIETMKNEIKTQKKKHEKELKEIKEELRKKNLEILNKENEISSTVKTPPRGKKGVVIITITDENRHRISNLLGGMLQNDDGSFSRTPMSETWARNKDHQLISRHDSAPLKPDCLDNIPEHPNPTTMDLKWSHVGEWRDVPMKTDGTGAAESKENRVGRIEPYIDTDGKIKKAICYGSDMSNLKGWYDLDEVKKVFPNWDISGPSIYYNGKRYSGTIRRELQEGKKNNAPPGDQSSRDIQGGRGKGKGRGSNGNSRGASGYSRGSYHNQSKGRGKDDYDRDYKKWDDWQSAGTSRGKRSQDEFSDYSSYSDSHEKSKRRESPGYYTREFEDKEKKRARSPSQERYSRRDRSIDRQRERRDHYCERREHRSGYDSSRDYNSDRQGRRDHSPRHRQERQDDRGRNRRDYSTEEGRRYPGHNR